MIPEHLVLRRATLVEQFNRAVERFGSADPGAAFFANRIREIDERIRRESGSPPTPHEPAPQALAQHSTSSQQLGFFAESVDAGLG